MNISYNKDVGGIIIDNLLQYLTWRGDISFKERAFNEIDALACAMIGYIEWDHIVDQTSVTLHEACLKNKQIHSHQELLETYAYSPSLVDFIKIIPQVSRYQDVKLKKYISVLDEDKGSQFAAITIELPDNKLFISFRGTDRTILGWKEDFEMAFLDMIPSQQMAVDYLKHAYDDVIEEKRILGFKYSQKVAQLYIGGHSKGGFNILNFLKGSVSGSIDAKGSAEISKLFDTTIKNTLLTDYIKKACKDELVKKFSESGVYAPLDSITLYRMYSSYLTVVPKEQIPIDMEKLNNAVLGERGYYAMLLKSEKIPKSVLRFNIDAFKNSYHLADLSKMDLTYYAVKVGTCKKSELSIEKEFEFQNEPKSVTAEEILGDKVIEKDDSLDVYDVVLAGVQ